MLKLVDITKIYSAGAEQVTALSDFSIEFRQNEFVSVLGQSGCGKTTLLNIIGGLDRYTSGDLIIKNRSTKGYTDHDWDTYRNHSIGFVFQSYNLIPHQTVLANVELALTLSGVSKKERRRRAVEALEKVGLGDQFNKKPNQMSGGQMQRVAIARALINNPEILLADEPTGALDSETSEQIMQLLKEVASDRLVIMVTHNPELADKYSTRIVKLLDGKIIGDTNPYTSESEVEDTNNVIAAKNKAKRKPKKKGTSMSFFTALSLSLNNLLTKKGRTFMTAFAGSIGIIGIALILSLSSGFQAYIDKVQEETLSSYPITIKDETVDMSELMATLMKDGENDSQTFSDDKIYANTDMYDMLEAYMNPEVNTNNLEKLKAWIDGDSGIKDYAAAIKYSYANAALKTYVDDTSKGILPANDYMALFEGMYTDSTEQMANSMQGMSAINIFDELLEGKNGEPISDMIFSQYELLDGNMRWPQNKNEVVLIVDKNNQIAETFLYSLGLIDRSVIDDLMMQIMTGEELVDENHSVGEWNFNDIIGRKYKLILPTDVYLGSDTDKDGTNDRWTDMSKDEAYMKLLLGSAEELEIVGIIRPKKDAVATAMSNCAIGYLSSLTDWYIEQINDTEIIKYQQAHPEIDILKGLPFVTAEDNNAENIDKPTEFTAWVEGLNETRKAEIFTLVATTPDKATLNMAVADAMSRFPDRASKEAMIINAYIEQSGMEPEAVKGLVQNMTDDEITKTVTDAITNMVIKSYAEEAEKQLSLMDSKSKAMALDAMVASADNTRLVELYDLTAEHRYSISSLSTNLDKFGYTEFSKPSAINLYAASFENKDKIAELIEDYNKTASEEDKISYTDYVALMMSSISTIIGVISYVLMAFVSISLVVSSIMIGIITYISVLERTKEIGILRSIGASKKDISRVFNAETLIVGFVAGALGIIVTVLLNIPINIIIKAVSDIEDVAFLPPIGGAILVAISMLLTLIAGLIPAKVAAKKDPVVALRTE